MPWKFEKPENSTETLNNMKGEEWGNIFLDLFTNIDFS